MGAVGVELRAEPGATEPWRGGREGNETEGAAPRESRSPEAASASAASGCRRRPPPLAASLYWHVELISMTVGIYSIIPPADKHDLS